MTKSNIKKRNWALIVYPESAPEDWIERLEKTGLPVAISPLHDKDINPTGDAKKPHWHVILSYAGPTAFNVVERIASDLNAPIPQAVESVAGYYNYLTHKDNPEKAQYDAKDIKHLNGFNIRDFKEITKSELFEIKKEIMLLARKLKIYEYAELLNYLLDNQLMDELEVAQNNTIFVDRYLSSMRHSQSKIEKENLKNDIKNT